jgi:transposase
VFTNRTRRQCRILVWERSGFVMWQKKLEKERFAWPKHTDTVVSISAVDLNLLLDGYDIWRVAPHQTLHYASMY